MISEMIDIIVRVVSITALLIALVLTYYQVRKFVLYEKAKFQRDLVITFYKDEDIRYIFYKIEYNEFKYTPDFHHSRVKKCFAF